MHEYCISIVNENLKNIYKILGCELCLQTVRHTLHVT